ncbi:C39 family peptidase [Patescibacteria group bacterium]|nr:C39 family peptidase [Patescibacteria group bacterium]
MNATVIPKWILIAVAISGLTLGITQNVAHAQDAATVTANVREMVVPDNSRIPILNVPIPGLDLSGAVTIDVAGGSVKSNMLGLYINAIYGWLITAASVMAVVMMMIAGLQYATARGNAGQVSDAKDRMKNVVIGMIMLLGANTIATFLDPNLTIFEPLSVQRVSGYDVPNETPTTFNQNYSSTAAEGLISIPLKSQKDYVNVPYGPGRCRTVDSGNIKSSGCGVVSFSMVAEALSGQSVNPPDVAESFYVEGFRPLDSNGCGHNGTMRSAFTGSSLVKQYGIKSRDIPIGNQQEIVDLLEQGKVLILLYKTDSGGGHYVVMSGIDTNGEAIISDPWGGVRYTRSFQWIFSRIKHTTYLDTEANFIQ